MRPKTARLDKSHLTQREKTAATGFVTAALILIGYGASFDAIHVAETPTLALVVGIVLILAVMLEVGRREESRTPK